MDDITTTNILWQTNIQIKTADNKGLPKAGLNGFDWTFVQGSTEVFLLKSVLKFPPSASHRTLGGTLIKLPKIKNDIMTPYFSTSGKKSGVTTYETGDSNVIVEFHSTQYKYSYNSCGRSAVETMKNLPLASNGLSTFIAQNKPDYEWKR